MTRAPGRTTERKPLTRLQRAKLFSDHSGICYRCSLPIDAARVWTDEHVVPLGLGGSNDMSNRRPVHMHCAAEKTQTEDMPRIVKAKAMQASVTSKDPGTKATLKSAGFAPVDKSQKATRMRIPEKLTGIGPSNLARRFLEKTQ